MNQRPSEPSRGEPQAATDETAGRRYGRRWFGYAMRATWRFFRSNVAWSSVGLVGAAAGIFLLTPVFLGSDRPDLVREEILLALSAAAGSALLLTIVVFAWEFINAPAAMEREADARAATRHDHQEQDLAAERRAHAELRDRIDASRLRIELIDESGPIAAVATNDEVKARFIESERQTLIAPLKQPKPQSQWPWEIDIYGESRSQKRFLAELNEYLAALDERWLPALANAAVDREVTELLFAARNNAEVGVSGVEIQLHLPDDFDAAWEEGDLWQEGIPDRPAAWGSYNAMTFFPDIIPGSPMSRSPGEIERRNGRLVITWNPFALTSKRNQPLAPVRLFVPGAYTGRTITVAWNAASVPGGEPIAGELDLTFGPDPVQPEMLLLPRERPE